jgi:hypothetical protein
MPKTHLTIPHSLGIEEARKRIARLAAETQQQSGGLVKDLKESWAGDTGHFDFRVMTMAISGQVDVKPAAIEIDITFPIAALPFKSTLEEEIQDRAGELLA